MNNNFVNYPTNWYNRIRTTMIYKRDDTIRHFLLFDSTGDSNRTIINYTIGMRILGNDSH